MIEGNDYTHIEERLDDYDGPELQASIVIPFYRGRDELERLLHSLSSQTYPRELMETIVVQDVGEEKIDDLAGEHDIRLVKLKHTGFTVATSRNKGLECASGDIIINLDYDMICTSSTVESHMKYFHVSDEVATFGLEKSIDASGIPPHKVSETNLSKLPHKRRGKGFYFGDWDYPSDKRMLELKILKEHPFPFHLYWSSNIAYRKRDAERIGGWDEDFNGNYGHEDVEFGHRLYRLGRYIVCAEGADAYHQINDNLSTERKIGGSKNNLPILYRKIVGIKLFKENVLPLFRPWVDGASDDD